MRPSAIRARLETSRPRPARFGFVSTTLLSLAITFVILANGGPAGAQGVVTFAQQSRPRSHTSVSFASIATSGATFSVSSTSSMYHPENSADGFAFRAAGYPEQSFGALLPVQQTKTSFITELRVPLAELYGSRVHVGFFILTMQNGNMTLGPLATLQALHSPSQPRSFNLYGVGLSIPLGKQFRPEASKNLWTTAGRLIRDH
ncbi:MAG: hypothetical protein ABSB65_15410 [Candidatus Acidiferrales bacterium]